MTPTKTKYKYSSSLDLPESCLLDIVNFLQQLNKK